MSIIRKICFLFLLPSACFALEAQPWFGGVYEFHFLGGYAYSRFHKVANAVPQLTSPFNVNLLFGGLDFTFSPQWNMDFDLEFADTTKESFGFRSFGLQGRYLWLDDIVGDAISLDTGGSVRITSSRSLHDISCPSHANADFELSIALGKEFDTRRLWRYRLWGFGAIGLANRGSPWMRGIFAFETNYDDRHKLGFFLLGSHGYGKETVINPNHFNGYGRVRQKSIDIAFRYGYQMGVWGTLRFEYDRRVYAKRYPENVNTFVISYLVPFSF